MAETMVQGTEEAVEKGRDAVSGDGSMSLAKRILIPAAAGAGTLAATYAARKAPDMFRDHVLPRLEDRGGEEAAKIGQRAAQRLESEGTGIGKLAGKAIEKVTGGGGGDGGKKTRRLPIQRWTDVAVPVDTAFEHWTEFENFPQFMHRVLSVEEKENDRVSWQEKIWFSKRQWEGEVVERRKNDRVAWKTISGMSHAGIVSFHPLAKNLTRVMVTMDFRPSGMIEKMASGLRFVKRAVQADLARFKAYVEMGEIEGLGYKTAAAARASDRKRDEERGDAKASDGGGDSGDERSPEEAESARQERAERREQRRS